MKKKKARSPSPAVARGDEEEETTTSPTLRQPEAFEEEAPPPRRRKDDAFEAVYHRRDKGEAEDDALRERYAEAEALLRQEEGQLKRLVNEVRQVQRARRAEKEKLDLLHEDIALIQNSHGMGAAHVERLRARRVTYLWAAQLLLTLVCLFGTHGAREWVFFGLNFFAFLCVWRGLYVHHNGSAQVVAMVVTAATLYLGK